MTVERRRAGQEAEDLAAVVLRRAGLRIVERNVRFALGELDLVCRDGDVWVFVEVKSRRADWGDPPSAAVGILKQRRLVRLAETYCRARRLREPRCRFDVVTVSVPAAGRPEVRHIVNAFGAD